MAKEGSSNSDFNKEIQQIIKNQIKNLEENLQKSIIEKIQANNKEIINHLEVKLQNKYGNEISALKQENVKLKLELEQKNNLSLNFIQIKNKWTEIKSKCCEKECINTDKPVGNCIEGNGFINIIDGVNIKYINCVGKVEAAGVTAENKFNKPKNDCINYSLFYFEIKCKIEGVKSVKNWMAIGLHNGNNTVKLDIDEAFIRYESKNKHIKFKLPSFSWNDGDIFGFGLVYPPNNKINELPYVFFTQNGKLIGKSLLLKDDNCDNYEICAHLKRCSIEANFGNDLKAKPFVYNINEHLAPKEFYVDSDGSESSLASMMASMAAKAMVRLLSD